MGKAKKKNSSEVNNWVTIFVVVFIVITVVYVLDVTQKTLSAKNQLETYNAQMAELKGKGINSENITVRKLDVNHKFSVGSLSYDVTSVYLASDVADLGDQRESLKVGSGNKVVMVEVGLEYTKDMGSKVDANVNRYISLRSAGKTYKPVSLDNLKVGPVDKIRAYVLFAVPQEVTEFSLVAGNPAKTTNLDFSSDKTVSMSGVLLLNKGYAPEYPMY